MVQNGMEPTDWKPMKIVGPGVKEIRIHGDNEHRVFYVAQFARAIYVLHAFVKKTQRTSRAAIDIAKARYREVLQKEGLKR